MNYSRGHAIDLCHYIKNFIIGKSIKPTGKFIVESGGPDRLGEKLKRLEDHLLTLLTKQVHVKTLEE